ncbi:MAG: hypothetical protein F6K31_35060 [Symploca sp. SIO2G7]|nr:hypothetical protein [Symploca sp. SIO2G7]
MPLLEDWRIERQGRCSQFPIPNFQFPIPNSQFSIFNSQFPIFNSQTV